MTKPKEIIQIAKEKKWLPKILAVSTFNAFIIVSIFLVVLEIMPLDTFVGSTVFLLSMLVNRLRGNKFAKCLLNSLIIWLICVIAAKITMNIIDTLFRFGTYQHYSKTIA